MTQVKSSRPIYDELSGAPNDQIFPKTSELSKMDFSIFQKPFQLIWRCPKNIYLFTYLRGTSNSVVSKILGSFFESSESFDFDGSCRKFEDTEKTYFHQKILGDVFRYTCAYQNFAKILGNINVYPNIIGVKLNNLIVLNARTKKNNFSDNLISKLMPSSIALIFHQVHVHSQLPLMLNETFSSFWNNYARQKFQGTRKTVRKLYDMIKVSTPIPKILGKLYGFPKKFEKSRASLRKKFRNFQATFHPNRYFTEIFRWVPLNCRSSFSHLNLSMIFYYIFLSKNSTKPHAVPDCLFFSLESQLRESREILGKQNSLFHSGPVIKC